MGEVVPQRDKSAEEKERDLVAHTIRTIRAKEQWLWDYDMYRTGAEYIEALDGLEALFSYVKGLPSNIVLDVGAGSTLGISQLATMPMTNGLDMHATVLSQHEPIGSHIKNNLGFEKTHVTSVEVLRGIPDVSVGAVLSVYGVVYSKAPNMAVQSIDRVLVDGGVFKGLFAGGDGRPAFDRVEFGLLGSDVFEKEFKKLGYTTAIKEILPSAHGYIRVILLAVKGGKVSAQALIDADSV